MEEKREQYEAYGSREHRLPALAEVLSRQTRPPVDLYSFYIYMRDQQRSVDYLDFWLDVSQHMSLCRHFVREMRRSVLLETPELDRAGSKRSSQLLDQFDLHDDASGDRDGSVYSELSQDQRVSRILREGPSGHSPKGSGSTHKSLNLDAPARPSFMSSNLGMGSSGEHSSGEDSTPSHTVTRTDVRASAEKILYTFLLAGSEREIILPPSVLAEIVDAIEEQGRDDPEVFDAAKEYVFQAMERDAFPGFLRSKAFGNLVPPSLMIRLVLGLVAIFGAFWAAFILVFIDASRATRCWIILPFFVGIYALASHQYTVDPVLALLGYSEYTLFSFTKMQEPFVRSLLVKRALVLSATIFVITVAVVCLFVFVPGKHL